MSNGKHETIADIVAALRAIAYIQTAESPSSVLSFANRIEAAAKREREAGAEAAQICGEIGEMVGREATCKKYSQIFGADTVRDIAEEMLNTSMQDLTAKVIYGWATRLAACEQSVTDCNHLGNAAKMRYALEQAQRVLHCAIVADILKGEDAHEALNAVSTALSAPPRNCDIPLIVDEAADNVADKAWLAFRRCNPNVYFDVSGLLGCIKWLFDEAKGEK